MRNVHSFIQGVDPAQLIYRRFAALSLFPITPFAVTYLIPQNDTDMTPTHFSQLSLIIPTT